MVDPQKYPVTASNGWVSCDLFPEVAEQPDQRVFIFRNPGHTSRTSANDFHV